MKESTLSKITASVAVAKRDGAKGDGGQSKPAMDQVRNARSTNGLLGKK
jgi:hypothetical protein